MNLAGLSARINRVVEFLLSVLGLGMALLVAVQVFFRYALNNSIFWSEELARFLLVWLTFLGASVVYFRGAHASVDFLYKRAGLGSRRVMNILVHLFSLAFFLVMAVYGWQFAHFIRLQVSAALNLPKWIPHSIIPLSGAILALHSLNFLWRELKGGANDGGQS
jgi:TRAP-type C4-dicarboxylate transport system permease small subunit